VREENPLDIRILPVAGPPGAVAPENFVFDDFSEKSIHW
jgi:hypothetical protein